MSIGRYVAGMDFPITLIGGANARFQSNCTLILDIRDANGLPPLEHLFKISVQTGLDPRNSIFIPNSSNNLNPRELLQTDNFRITILGLNIGLNGTITLHSYSRFTRGNSGHLFYQMHIYGSCDYSLSTRRSNGITERFVHISAQQDFERNTNTSTTTTNPTQITLQGRLGTDSSRYIGGEVRITPNDTVATANAGVVRRGLPSFNMQQIH